MQIVTKYLQLGRAQTGVCSYVHNVLECTGERVREYVLSQYVTVVHYYCRSLGVQHSFVLSCTLDDWTEEQVDFMETHGNIVVNTELEYNVPKTIEVPFEKTTDRDTREKYINAKYVDKLFCKSEGKSSRPPQRIHRANSRSPNSSPTLRDAAMVEFIGIVNVQLLSCSKLIVKDFISSDPYCVLTIGLQSRKSTVKYKCLNPTYNEDFSFSWNGQDMLVLEVFDKDELSKDDHMGKTEIDLSFLKDKSGKAIECWYPITHRKHKDKQQGEVSLSLTFVPLA